MENNLINAFAVLYSKKEEMKRFFSYYIFKRIRIDMLTFVDNKEQFIRFISFCLHTRQRVVINQLDKGILYFSINYTRLHACILSKNITELQSIVYNAPGVGQKIGSLIIELIYLYSKHADDTILINAYLPIDVHTKRIFEDSFRMKVPDVAVKVSEKRFLVFQRELTQYTENNYSRVYFDYLWFIGKVFCTKISESESNKGYKLCDMCWIQPYCLNMKWNQ